MSVGIRAEIMKEAKDKEKSFKYVAFKKKLSLSCFVFRMVRWRAILCGH